MTTPSPSPLGDRDPLTVLRQLICWLRERTEGLDDQQLRRREAQGRWSVVDAIEHLVDAEIVHGCRLRMVLEHDGVTLHGWDPDLWAARGHYASGDVQADLVLLDLLRERNLTLIANLSDEDRKRVGVHTSRGAESMDVMVVRMAEHDLVHRGQIDRVLASHV